MRHYRGGERKINWYFIRHRIKRVVTTAVTAAVVVCCIVAAAPPKNAAVGALRDRNMQMRRGILKPTAYTYSHFT